MPARHLAEGQTCSVHIASVGSLTADGVTSRVVLTTSEILLEAPNWSLDGAELILNGDGLLWRLPVANGVLTRIEIDVPELNNDHVLDPDGEHVFVSANDAHIYRANLRGGPARRITEDDGGLLHFLHGVSPDGATLTFAGIERDGEKWGAANIYTVSAGGGPARQITPGQDRKDGPEFSPDGAWIYFNTEQFSDRPGHAQVARMRPDGSGVEQLTFDERVNWFPHLAATGDRAMYISFPPGTLGHPTDVEDVRVMIVDNDWTSATAAAELFGGQGTANVHNWSPDGTRFAYVSYSRPSAAPEIVHI
jgi:TolB protein